MWKNHKSMLSQFQRAARGVKRILTSQSGRVPCAKSILRTLIRHKAAVVVQVGSNDGVQGDPICDLIRENPSWRVLFVEPLPHLVLRLKANYASTPNYTFENVAVSSRRERRPLYYISDEIKLAHPDVPFWYDQLGSFEREHIVRHAKEFEHFIVTEDVQCEPLSEILSRNSIEQIDLLHIDTEGYDYEVLKQVDLARHAPRAILYEHKHLNESDAGAAEHLLRRGGYLLQRLTSDTLAVAERSSRTR